ncbi:MAG: hypothetical protein Q7R56_03135 [Nanoarchaeota archaeon]|nr:hypothetical protein [Nanoarchaeota archaeon]
MAGIPELIQSLENIGFFRYLAPFLVIFTITFALLEKVKLFGTEGKKFNMIIAIGMGLLFLRQERLLDLFGSFTSNIGFIILILLMVFFIFAIFSGEHRPWSGLLLTLGFFIAIIAVVTALISSQGTETTFGQGYSFQSTWIQWLGLDSFLGADAANVVSWLITIGVLVALVIWFLKSPKRANRALGHPPPPPTTP